MFSEDPNVGPSVEAALSTSPTQALAQAEPRKATIGGRKAAAPKKSGVGFCLSCQLYSLFF